MNGRGPGAPYVVAAVDGIGARDLDRRVLDTLPEAAAAYAELSEEYADRWYVQLVCYSEGGHDYDSDGLESEEREAIESGDADFARETLVEMGWEVASHG